MAQGEKRWSSEGETVKRVFIPVPPKDWDCKMVTTSAEIAAGSTEKGGIPFIKGIRFICFGSALQEGQKERMIFQNFFLSLRPGKDGNVMPDYANQLKGLSKALGDVRDFDVASKTINEAGETVDYLSPKGVLASLKEHDGDSLALHSKIENDAVYGKKAVVEYFIEAGSTSPATETEEIEETDDEGEVEEEEEAPKPKTKAKSKKK